MTGNEITITVIAAIFGLVATILSILTFFKNDKKDGKKDAEEVASIKTDISYIKDGIGELKTLVQAQTKEQNETNLKIQKLEDRVDSIEQKLEGVSIKKSSTKKGGK